MSNRDGKGMTLLRGRVIQVPEGALPGLIHADARQITFFVEGVWRSPVAPALNQRVEVHVDAADSVVAIDVIGGQKAAGELLQRVGRETLERGGKAASAAQGWLAGPGRAGFTRAVAAVRGWIGAQRAAGRLPKLIGGAAAVLLAIAVAGHLRGCSGGSGSYDPAAPFDGRPVVSSGQIEGAWLRLAKGPLVGVEFLKDGNALVQSYKGNTAQQRYSLLEGGRVSLIAPNGHNEIYLARIAGDVLELSVGGGMRDGVEQRFRRVPEGQTLAEAYRADLLRKAAGREHRAGEIDKLLASDALVLVPVESSMFPTVIALRVEDGNAMRGWHGDVFVDEEPKRKYDGVNAIHVHQFAAVVEAVDPESDELRFRIDIRPATEPASEAGVTGGGDLRTVGAVGKTALRGKAQLNVRGQNTKELVLELRQDTGGHKAVLDRLQAQRDAIRALHERVASALGGRSNLAGSKTRMTGQNAPEQIDVAIVREHEGNDYAVSGKIGAQQVRGSAKTDIYIGRPALQVNLSGGEQWVLDLQDDGKTFKGPWRPNTYASLLEYGDVALNVTRRWTLDETRKAHEAAHRFLADDLQKQTRLIGYATGGLGGTVGRWPLDVDLVVDADGNTSGIARYPAHGGGVKLKGKLQGDVLTLNSTDLLEGYAPRFRSQAQQRFTLSVDETRERPTLIGNVQVSFGGADVELAPIDEKAVPAMRQRVLDALAGARFTANGNKKMKEGEAASFDFRVDKTSGALSGEIVGASYSYNVNLPPGQFTGEIVDVGGRIALKLATERLNARPRLDRWEYWLYADFDEKGLRLDGWTLIGNMNLDPLTLTPAVQR